MATYTVRVEGSTDAEYTGTLDHCEAWIAWRDAAGDGVEYVIDNATDDERPTDPGAFPAAPSITLGWKDEPMTRTELVAELGIARAIANYWHSAAAANYDDAKTYRRQRDDWQEEARLLGALARQTANVADVERERQRIAALLDKWRTAQRGTDECKDAYRSIALLIGNLPNFDRARAIGLAEAVLTDWAVTQGIADGD